MLSYEKINDHTLLEKLHIAEEGGFMGSHLTRIFNFAARQVTLIQRNYRGQNMDSQTHFINFSAFESQAEIEIMRKKLIAYGGNPPPAPEEKPALAKVKLHIQGKEP